MVVFADHNLSPVGQNKVDSADVTACTTPAVVVETVAAIEQKPAQGHGGAIRHGEGQAVRRELLEELRAAHGRTDACRARGGIDGQGIEAAEVEHHATRAQRRRAPAMTSAAHGDPALLLAGKGKRAHDVGPRARPYDQIGPPLGHHDVPGDAPHRLVQCVSGQQEIPVELVGQFAQRAFGGSNARAAGLVRLCSGEPVHQDCRGGTEAEKIAASA